MSQEENVRRLIERYGLAPHPEGGFYRETVRSGRVLAQSAIDPGYAGDRAAVTSILFLLPTGMRSRWHRVRSDEIWLHHQGDELRLRMHARDQPESKPISVRLGPSEGAELQAVVPPQVWQDAEALPGPAGYCLVGCVVAPGFDFADFEMDASLASE